VVEVMPGGPAAAAGLQADALVVGIDGEPVTGIDDLARLLDHTRIGAEVVLDVLHAGARRNVIVVPVDRDDGFMARQ